MTVYDFDGNKYREASKHQQQWGSKIISDLVLVGNEVILDLGCGDGLLTSALAERVPAGRVVGIDASQGMISVARKLAGANLTFREMDINQISFANEFDVIFSNAALHWVKDHSSLLHNCLQALKYSGYIRWNFAGKGNCYNFFSVVREVIQASKYEPFFKRFKWPWYMPGVDEYEKAVNAVGFSEVLVWDEVADRYFPDKDAMIKWIDQPSLVPFLGYLDESLRADFRNSVIEKMIARTLQPDGTCFEYFRRINIYAKK